MKLDKSAISKFVCIDCLHISWTSLNKGCTKCGSKNLNKPTEDQIIKFDSQNLIDLMSSNTDVELIRIVKTNRNDYTPEAVSATEKEIEKRQLNSTQITLIHQKLVDNNKKTKEEYNHKVLSYTISCYSVTIYIWNIFNYHRWMYPTH